MTNKSQYVLSFWMEDKKLRIAFLGPAPPYRGGISKFATTLAEQYAAMGYEVRMFNFESQYPALLFPGSDQYDDNAPKLRTERVFTPYLPLSWSKAVRRIRRFAPHIVIASYWIPLMAPSMGWILRKLIKSAENPEIILLVHNIEFHEKWPMAHKLSLYLLKTAHKIVLLSQKSYDDVTANFPTINQDRLILGFHPIYTDYLAEAQAPQPPPLCKRPTVLFFGFIKSYKGLDILLKAMYLVRKKLPTIRLVIAGDVYGDKTVWENMIGAMELIDITTSHFGYIADSEIAGLFQNASVCVLPYKSATQSGIIATSYAFDLPVIASDVGGLSEYIIEAETGFLVPSENYQALAEKILYYFKENCEAPMRAQIRQYKQSYTWDRLAALITE